MNGDILHSITRKSFENGEISILEAYLVAYAEMGQNREVLNIFSTLLDQYNNTKNSILGSNLLLTLAEFPEYSTIEKLRSYVHESVLSNDKEIADYAISCIEKWEDTSALEVLSKCATQKNWIGDYANKVYQYLKTKKSI